MSHDPAPTAERLHATCIAFGEFGVLLIGPSGSGKSDLALRLIDEGGFGIGTSRLEAALVSDDQVLLQRQGDEVMASAPATIAALLEVRGLGIVCPARRKDRVPLRLIVRLVERQAIERMPDPAFPAATLLGIEIPEISLCAKDVSAPAKVRCALQIITGTGRLIGFSDRNSS